MTTMNVSIPEALREYLDERDVEGCFAKVSDYVRSLIRDDRARRAKALLESKLLEGLASGPAEEATEAYWKRLEAEVRARASKRRRSR